MILYNDIFIYWEATFFQNSTLNENMSLISCTWFKQSTGL